MKIDEAMKMLGCSRATAYRLRKAGKLASALKKASPKERDVPIDPYYENASAPAPVAESAAPLQESLTPRELSDTERRELEDADYAERYKKGEATDSYGNTLTGNQRFPSGKISALGPMEPAPPKQRVGCDDHMEMHGWHERFIPRVAKPWDDDCRELWSPGHIAKLREDSRNSETISAAEEAKQ